MTNLSIEKFISKHSFTNPEGITVCSTFDGISALQVAFKRLGIKVKQYFAYEIDPFAISVTRKHFPKTVFMGDITKADPEFFKDIKVDFFSGGFPCQNYSVAGNNTGTKGKTGRLLYPMIDLFKALKKMNPDMDFFFENVKMKKEFLDEVNEVIGVQPQLWNSALVSGQNRQRFYWTSLKHIQSITDRNIVLSDILEPIVDAKYCAGRNLVQNYQGGNQLNPTYKSQCNTIHNPHKKAPTICSGTHGYAIGYIPSAFASRGRYNEDGSTSQQMEFRFDNKTNAITTVQKDNYITMSKDMGVDVVITEGVDLVGNQARDTLRTDIHKGSCLMARDYKGFGNQGQTGVRVSRCVQVGEADLKKADGTKYSNEQMLRVYSPDGWSPNVDTQGGGHREIKILTSETTYRKLTPKECSRLQTFDDGFTEYGVDEKGKTVKISDTQQYKMLGNSWTVEMVVELLRDYQPKLAIAV